MVQRKLPWQQRYMDTFYRSNPGWIDGTEEFHRLCASSIPAGAKILELGPGPSNRTSRFLATIGELHGLDPDPDARDNDALTSCRIVGEGRFPLAAESFDACVSNYVVEHVADPEQHLREIARALKPRGVYVFRTPNLFHYVGLVSRVAPHWFHVLVANRVKNEPRTAHDPYPTVYRLNSARSVRRWAEVAGFEVSELRMIEKEPSYGMASRLMFIAGVAYERVVNAIPTGALRANILTVLRKR